jgi:nicotinamide mononucleotide transporter
MRIVNKWVWIILSALSAFLFVCSLNKWIPIGPTEVLGFVSGAVCVLFVVNQNIWNFPVGIANNIFFIILFLSSRLYGDMALQGIYIVLGCIGWWQWLYGGKNRTELHINHASLKELMMLCAIGTAATMGLREYFIHIHDSAPFLDSVTTVVSLIAQYLLNCKRIENWFVWITADILYIGLYLQKELYLTAILYAIFIGMCTAGLLSWKKAERAMLTKAIPQ